MEKTNITSCVAKTYLIGSMESPAKKEGATVWRDYVEPRLLDMGIYVFNPTHEESLKVGMSTKDLMEKLTGWQLSGNRELFCEYMSKIWKGIDKVAEDPQTGEPFVQHILGDIDYVNHSNFLTWGYDEGDRLGGTIAELTLAWQRGIPVYLITECPISRINKSLLYFVYDSGQKSGQIFHSKNEFLDFAKEKYGRK